MKRLLKVTLNIVTLTLILVMIAIGAAKLIPVAINGADKHYAEKYKKMSHFIFQNSLSDAKGCSATAVGPHALLTATHCEVASDEISIDGLKGYHIVPGGIIRDGYDHSIYLLKDITFKEFATVRETRIEDGEKVFFWGNPQLYALQLRVGYARGLVGVDGVSFRLFDFWCRGGDSGSGIFDFKGELVEVLSLRVDVPLPPNGQEFIGGGALPLQFKKSDFDKARAFDASKTN